jgi:RNA polymerase sigma factor (sigma-70 family)
MPIRGRPPSPLRPDYPDSVEQCAAANCPWCRRALLASQPQDAPRSVTACGPWGPDPLVGYCAPRPDVVETVEDGVDTQQIVACAEAVPVSADPYPPLTAEQEQLITDHLTFAERGASRYFRLYRGKFERDEFVSAAYTGLVVAARKFDPARGCTFKTYAFFWIDQSLKRLPRTERRQTGWAYNPTQAEEAAGKHGMVRVVEIAQWPEVVGHQGDTEAFDAPSGAVSIEDEIIHRSEQAGQRRAILASVRSPRTRRLLADYLDGLTMQDLADREGLTRSRVHQLLAPAIERARRRFNRRS